MRTGRLRRSRPGDAKEEWNQYFSSQQQNSNNISDYQFSKPSEPENQRNINVIRVAEQDDSFFDNLPLQTNIPTHQQPGKPDDHSFGHIDTALKSSGTSVCPAYSCSNLQELDGVRKLSTDNSSDNSAIPSVNRAGASVLQNIIPIDIYQPPIQEMQIPTTAESYVPSQFANQANTLPVQPVLNFPSQTGQNEIQQINRQRRRRRSSQAEQSSSDFSSANLNLMSIPVPYPPVIQPEIPYNIKQNPTYTDINCIQQQPHIPPEPVPKIDNHYVIQQEDKDQYIQSQNIVSNIPEVSQIQVCQTVTQETWLKPLFSILPFQSQDNQRVKDTILQICMSYSQYAQTQADKNAFLLLCYTKAQIYGESFSIAQIAKIFDCTIPNIFLDLQNAIKQAQQQQQFDLTLLLLSLQNDVFMKTEQVADIQNKIMQKYNISQCRDLFLLDTYGLGVQNVCFNIQTALSIMSLQNVQKFIKYMFLCLNNPVNDIEIIKLLIIIFFQDESIINYNIYVYFYAKLITECNCTELSTQELQELMKKNNTLEIQQLQIFPDNTLNALLMELLEYCQFVKIRECRQQENEDLFSYLKLQSFSFSPLVLIQKIHTYALIDNPYILQSQKFEYINLLMQYMKSIVQRIPENKQYKKYAYLQNANQVQTNDIQNCKNLHDKIDLIYLLFQQQNSYKLNVQINLNGQMFDLLNINIMNVFDPNTKQIFTEYGKLLYQVAQRYNLSFHDSDVFKDELVSIGNLFAQQTRQQSSQQLGIGAQQAKQVISKLADNLAKIIFWK